MADILKNRKIAAVVAFERRSIGKHAGKWTVPCRRGEIVPRIETCSRVVDSPSCNGELYATAVHDRKEV